MSSVNVQYGKVHVFDDILPDSLYNEIAQATGKIGWRFGWNTPSNPHNRYWHHEVGRGNKLNEADVSENVRKHPAPAFAKYQDWLRQNVVPEDTRILRYYLNAHTYGTDGWPHTDTDRREELTAILYLSENWQPEWCGETVIFDAKGDIEAAVMPRRNRILIFPSDRLHAPRPLSKSFGGLRVVLVVKMGAPNGKGAEFTRL